MVQLCLNQQQVKFEVAVLFSVVCEKYDYLLVKTEKFSKFSEKVVRVICRIDREGAIWLHCFKKADISVFIVSLITKFVFVHKHKF